MATDGYIKLHRKVTRWRWYTHPTISRVFFHLLLLVNHEDKVWRDITIKAGQTVTSYRHIADDLDISADTAHKAVKQLQKSGELEVKSNARYTIITVINYSEYQANRTLAEHLPNDSRTLAESNKNDKNDKNEKKDIAPAAKTESGGWKARKKF